jgi:glycosyltransferase involved in cell wall biosynthesis
MCNSEYVCFLDADDILHSEKIEHQASLVAEKSFRPDLIAAASKRVYIDDPSMPTHVSIPHSDKWVGLITSSLGITSSNLWKVSAVRAVGGWSESVMRSTDAELMFKMLRDKATVCRDTVPLTTLRRRDDSLWNRNLAASRKDFLKLRCKIKSFIDDSGGLTEKHKKAFADLFHIIRKVRKEDPSFANRMYYKLIPDGHRPYFGSLYKTIMSILGFGPAEKFYEWYAPIRKISRSK